MLSLTCALLISGTLFKYWFAYEAKLMMEQASLELKIAQEKRNHERLIQSQLADKKLQEQKKEQKIENAKRQKQQKLITAERNRKISAYKTKVEVCVFWRKQYKKYHTSYEERMMNTACK